MKTQKLRALIREMLSEAERDAGYLKKINAQKIRRQRPDVDRETLERESTEGPIFSNEAIEFVHGLPDDLFVGVSRKEFAKWIANVVTNQNVDVGYEFAADMEIIRDWIVGANPEGWQNYSFLRAYDAAGDWHDSLEAKEEVAGSEGDEVVYRFPDGWTIRRLQACSLDSEGKAMGHCVGGYEKSVTGGFVKIFSLRSPQNKPHVTIEIDKNDVVRQIKGKQNKPPVQEYGARVREWLHQSPFIYKTSSDYILSLPQKDQPPFIEKAWLDPELDVHDMHQLTYVIRRLDLDPVLNNDVSNEIFRKLFKLTLQTADDGTESTHAFNKVEVLLKDTIVPERSKQMINMASELNTPNIDIVRLIARRRKAIADHIWENQRIDKKIQFLEETRDSLQSLLQKFSNNLELLDAMADSLTTKDLIIITSDIDSESLHSDYVTLGRMIADARFINDAISKAKARAPTIRSHLAKQLPDDEMDVDGSNFEYLLLWIENTMRSDFKFEADASFHNTSRMNTSDKTNFVGMTILSAPRMHAKEIRTSVQGRTETDLFVAVDLRDVPWDIRQRIAVDDIGIFRLLWGDRPLLLPFYGPNTLSDEDIQPKLDALVAELKSGAGI